MKEWETLSFEEDEPIWDEIIERFKFNPKSIVNNMPFLVLPKPFQIYDIHVFIDYLVDESTVINEEFYNNFNVFIKNALIVCMGDSDFLYALDWQHRCFKYNPKSFEKMPHELNTEEESIYFPEFYPDGDFYFFVAKDFSWGYFTHPWTQELWVFGEKLLAEIQKVPSIYLTLKA